MKTVNYPTTRALAILHGLNFGFCLITSFYFILRGNWGSIVSILWLKPENSFFSFEFILFSIVAIVAFFGAIFAIKKPHVGYILFGVSVLLIFPFLCFLSKGHLGKSDILTGLIIFILPGFFFISRGIKEKKFR